MASSSCMLLIFLIPIIITIIPFFTFSTAQPSNSLSGTVCSSTGDYTPGSTYDTNLKALLTRIYSDSTKNIYDFYSLSDGQGSDTAYAVTLCRGDISISLCSACIQRATSDILRNCPSEKEAIIIYDYCFLRYSDQSIISGVMHDNVVFYLYNLNSVSDVTLFNQDVTLFLQQLTKFAEAGSSTVKFAKGEFSSTDFQPVYGIVQCNPDLSELDCANCLGTIIRQFPTYISGKQGGRVYSPSCNLRFEMFKFYF